MGITRARRGGGGCPLRSEGGEEHVGGVVDQEWARAHGKPYELVLTGPAGGRFVRGTGGEQITLDAIDFARLMSGRGTGDGLLATTVPF